MATGPLVKMTLLLRPEEAARLDAFCRERGHKKSTLVATLLRRFLDGEEASEGSRTKTEPKPRIQGD